MSVASTWPSSFLAGLPVAGGFVGLRVSPTCSRTSRCPAADRGGWTGESRRFTSHPAPAGESPASTGGEISAASAPRASHSSARSAGTAGGRHRQRTYPAGCCPAAQSDAQSGMTIPANPGMPEFLQPALPGVQG